MNELKQTTQQDSLINLLFYDGSTPDLCLHSLIVLTGYALRKTHELELNTESTTAAKEAEDSQCP
jgi:hypothetical protein